MDWWFIAPIQLVILGMVHYCFTNITRAKHRALPCFLGRIKLLNWFTSPNNNAKNHVKKNRCWKISARLRHESSYSPLQFCRQWWYDHFPMKNHSHLIYSNFWPWHIVRWVVVLKIKAIKMMLQMPRTRTFVLVCVFRGPNEFEEILRFFNPQWWSAWLLSSPSFPSWLAWLSLRIICWSYVFQSFLDLAPPNPSKFLISSIQSGNNLECTSVPATQICEEPLFWWKKHLFWIESLRMSYIIITNIVTMIITYYYIILYNNNNNNSSWSHVEVQPDEGWTDEHPPRTEQE